MLLNYNNKLKMPKKIKSTLNINSIHGGQVEQRYSLDERGWPTGVL